MFISAHQTAKKKKKIKLKYVWVFLEPLIDIKAYSLFYVCLFNGDVIFLLRTGSMNLNAEMNADVKP